MNSKKSAANDLFLLMLNLSQMAKKENVIDVFIGALETIWPNIKVKHIISQQRSENNLVQISAAENPYDYLRIDNLVELDNEDGGLLNNACGMLAVILRKLEQDFLLSNEKNRLQKSIKEHTQHLSKEIEERKHTEEDLRKAKELLTNAIDNSPTCMCLVKTDGYFSMVNKSLCDMFDYTETELKLKTFQEVTHPDDYNIGADSVKKLISGNIKQVAFKKRYLKKNGEIFYANIQSSVLRDKKGTPVYFFTHIEDITDKMKADQEILKAKNNAQESDRLKSAFLANMSHEIRTPMNGILGFSKLLKTPGLTGNKQQKYIDIIEKSGTRMLNIINDIISISKIESGTLDISLSETNIDDQVEFVYNSLKLDAENKGLKLSFIPSLPEKELVIITDREKFIGILSNLVKNAIKYTDTGKIEFGYTEKEEFYEFYVKDTGIGIHKDRQKAVFERFIQADIEDKMAQQGAGLGLSISKAYAEVLGGKIWMESEPGKGSAFYFTIPFITETWEKLDSKIEEVSAPIKDHVKNLKILIAEDDPTSEMLLSVFLDPFARELIKTTTGTETVEACRRNPDIDLVLMDIQMPGMNGYEATRKIREFNKNMVIIAQTAFGLSGDREKAIKVGCNEYISKPIDEDNLLALLQKLKLV